jgi:Tol biopolymer transport system component
MVGRKIVARPVAASGETETLATGLGTTSPLDWAADGRLLFSVLSAKGRSLWVVPSGGDRTARLHLDATGGAGITSATFSPDSRWIAFASSELGPTEIFIAPSDRGAERQRVSMGGGGQPRWGRNGTELYYLSSGRNVMAASIATAPRLSIGAPRLLFSAAAGTDITSFDVTRDGDRFLLVTRDDEAARPRITVTTRWTARANGQ